MNGTGPRREFIPKAARLGSRAAFECCAARKRMNASRSFVTGRTADALASKACRGLRLDIQRVSSCLMCAARCGGGGGARGAYWSFGDCPIAVRAMRLFRGWSHFLLLVGLEPAPGGV